jgi:hypothetical protein
MKAKLKFMEEIIIETSKQLFSLQKKVNLIESESKSKIDILESKIEKLNTMGSIQVDPLNIERNIIIDNLKSSQGRNYLEIEFIRALSIKREELAQSLGYKTFIGYLNSLDTDIKTGVPKAKSMKKNALGLKVGGKNVHSYFKRINNILKDQISPAIDKDLSPEGWRLELCRDNDILTIVKR